MKSFFKMSETTVNPAQIASHCEDKWKGIANSEKTRNKYEEYIEITERFLEEQKFAKKKKSDDQGDFQEPTIMTAKFRFRCKLCKKSCVGVVGTTSAIISHLKVC